MDESEHIIGSQVTHETNIDRTIENYFMNLTSVADSTVHFKAIWKQNELYVNNDSQTITASPSAQLLKPVDRAENGSGNYSYEIANITPTVNFVGGPAASGDNYGFEFDVDSMQIKVPAYVGRGTYIIRVRVRDDFTQKTRDFYVTLTVKNPTVTVDGHEYEFSLDQKWDDWYYSGFNNSVEYITGGYDRYNKTCSTGNTNSSYYQNIAADTYNYLGKSPVKVSTTNNNR